MDEKNILREKLKVLRRSIGDHVAERIASLFFGLPELQQAARIALYYSRQDWGEINTVPVIKQLIDSGYNVAIPKVTGAASMEMVEIYSYDVVSTGYKHIPEAMNGRVIGPKDLELIVVPLLGADLTGFRIGYGGGYYDRYLKKTPAHRVAFLPECCIIDRVPREPHDVPMNTLITEKRIIRI